MALIFGIPELTMAKNEILIIEEVGIGIGVWYSLDITKLNLMTLLEERNNHI